MALDSRAKSLLEQPNPLMGRTRKSLTGLVRPFGEKITQGIQEVGMPLARGITSLVTPPGEGFFDPFGRVAARMKPKTRAEIDRIRLEKGSYTESLGQDVKRIGSSIMSQFVFGEPAVKARFLQLGTEGTGLESLFENPAKQLEEWQGMMAAEDPDLMDALGSGAGSFLFNFIPGQALVNISQLFKTVDPGTARMIAASLSGFLEATSEAGVVYQQLLSQGVSREIAHGKASTNFWANAIWATLTNRIGLFSGVGSGGSMREIIKRSLATGSAECVQEVGQQLFGNLATNRSWYEGMPEACGIGFAIGAAAGAATVVGNPNVSQDLTTEEGFGRWAREHTKSDLAGQAASKGFGDLATKIHDMKIPSDVNTPMELEAYIKDYLTAEENVEFYPAIRNTFDNDIIPSYLNLGQPTTIKESPNVVIPPRLGLSIQEVPENINELITRSKTPQEFRTNLGNERLRIQQQITQEGTNQDLEEQLQRIAEFLNKSEKETTSFFENTRTALQKGEITPAELIEQGQPFTLPQEQTQIAGVTSTQIPVELQSLAERAKQAEDVSTFVSEQIFGTSLPGEVTKVLRENFPGTNQAEQLTNFYNTVINQATGRTPQLSQGRQGGGVPPRVPPTPSTAYPSPIGNPVEALNALLRQAIPVRRSIQRQYTEERSKRIAEVERRIEQTGGEEGFIEALKALKGELIPKEDKVQFESIKGKLTQEQLTDLYNMTWQHPYLDMWEKVNSAAALTDLLQGEIPTPKQLVLLEEIYGTDLIKNLLAKRALGLKIKDMVVDILNVPRVLLATAEMSGMLRQGVVYVTAHPMLATDSVKRMFRFAFSPKSFEQYFKDLPKDSLYKLMRQSKLAITDPSRRMTEKEEAFISRSLQQLPVFGQIVKFAERAYVGFLTKLRVDVFKMYAEEGLTKGYSPVKDADWFKSLANMVNTYTGRGTTGPLERVNREMSIVFFSPRLISARFNALNPIWYMRMPGDIRKKALFDFAKFVLVGLTTLALAKIWKGDELSVETDPRSSDFGKMRIGNTRWDIWGGFQQWVRVFSQALTGERKDTKTGEIISLTKDEYPFTTRKETIQRFIEGKLAPFPQLVNELISGAKTFTGEDMTITGTIQQNVIPFYLQDITEAYQEGGLGRAIGTGVPAFFGIGVQTWQPKPSKSSGTGGLKTRSGPSLQTRSGAGLQTRQGPSLKTR